ncbi:MAG: Tm-1-like ATP-binding domain-containing protein [Deltaproteobacteria bacterium]|nr:MAG: Tm-1-like ATP-binding domain-containing protein [Deltaproteobacteria bacterium]
MNTNPAIAVVGTFDSKAEEHIFLRDRIKQRGFPAMTINVGTKNPAPVPVNLDLFKVIGANKPPVTESRDASINAMLLAAKARVKQLHRDRKICGIISAGGGTGTYLCTSIMRELPLDVPKVMISTVASRNMAEIVSTKDITMIHSVVDLLGVNSISGRILDKAAAAICAMAQSKWESSQKKKRIALPFFGFITRGAEATKLALEGMGYEVIAFHANGTGGMAMEELAAEGYFDGILDLATHELADDLMEGYCGGIGPERYEPVLGRSIPRLVVPGGLDCAVLEFTRQNIPDQYKTRKIFFYDFRSAIRLNIEETRILADQLAEKLNKDAKNVKILIPLKGWSEADDEEGPLYDPPINDSLTQRLREKLDSQIEIREVEYHINDSAFADIASKMMDEMIRVRS